MTMLGAISDAVWVAVIGGIVTVFGAWIKLSGDRHAKAQALVSKDIHTLVNNNMGVQLKLVMELSEWKAKAEPSPENVAAAEAARANYEGHQRKQAVVDAASKPSMEGPV